MAKAARPLMIPPLDLEGRLHMPANSELVGLGKRLAKKIGDDDLSGAAAEMAYRFFLAIFPLFIFLAAIGGFLAALFGIADPTERIMNEIGGSLPPDASSVLRGQLTAVIGSKDPTLVSVAIIGAIWATSSGMNTVIKGLN